MPYNEPTKLRPYQVMTSVNFALTFYRFSTIEVWKIKSKAASFVRSFRFVRFVFVSVQGVDPIEQVEASVGSAAVGNKPLQLLKGRP